MIDDEALAHQPAHGDAVLEERVHPRIRMRIVRRSRAVDGVAAGVRGHGHHAHAVGQAPVDGLQVLVVEGLGQQHRGNGFDELRVGDRAVLGLVGRDARLGVGIVFAAQAHDQVRDGLPQTRVLGRVALLESGQFCRAGLLQLAGLGHKAIALGVEDRAHVSLGHRSDGAQHALFAAARAGAVAGNQRVVVGAHHEHVAQRRGLRVRRIGAVIQAQVLLRGVGQQIEEVRAGLVLGVHLFGLLHHLQRLVVAAGRDAGRAAFAQIAHENGKDAARAGLSCAPATRRWRSSSGRPSAPCP